MVLMVKFSREDMEQANVMCYAQKSYVIFLKERHWNIACHALRSTAVISQGMRLKKSYKPQI
jgi:hypothetical protein